MHVSLVIRCYLKMAVVSDDTARQESVSSEPPPLPTRRELQELTPSSYKTSYGNNAPARQERSSSGNHPMPTRAVPVNNPADSQVSTPRPRRLLFQADTQQWSSTGGPSNVLFQSRMQQVQNKKDESWKSESRKQHEAAQQQESQANSSKWCSDKYSKTSWHASKPEEGTSTENASSSWEAPDADVKEQSWTSSTWKSQESQQRPRGRDIIRQYGGSVRDHSLMTGAVTREDSVDPEGHKPDKKGPPPKPWWHFKKNIPEDARPWDDPEEDVTAEVLSVGMPDDDRLV